MNLNSFIAFLFFFTVLFQSACSAQAYRLSNRNLDKDAQYGWSCAVNSEYVVTGGPSATYTIRGKQLKEGGKAIVYKQLKGKWVVFQELTNPNMDDYGWFGNDVAMNESYLVVAASGYSKNNTEDHSNREGVIHIYKLDPTNGQWIKKYSILSPDPNKQAEFGKKIKLKGDTLAVFYEKGKNFDAYPNRQAIAFYNLKSEEKKPFKNFSIERNGNPVYHFNFDFNDTLLMVGQGANLMIYSFDRTNLVTIDSINIGSHLNIDGIITDIQLHENQFFIGFHEYMYAFWGYTPYEKYIYDGDSVLKKTTLDEATGSSESLLLPNDDKILNQYGVTKAFFNEHAHIYETYETLAKRKGGAGVVLVYNIKDNKLVLSQKLMASKRHADDWFGQSIAVSGDNLLIGAMGYPDKPENNADFNAKFSGAAFLFKRSDSGEWEEKEMYRSYHERRWDKFSFSLNCWNNIFVIGARFDRYSLDVNNVTGAVYILSLD